MAAYRVMAAQGGGHIVNTASLAGLVSAPLALPYATAKHGVVGLSLSLRAEAASLGVKVSAVCPGPIETRFHDALVVPPGSKYRPRAPADSIDVADAAERILDAVQRNQALVIFPGSARRIWFFWRFLRPLFARINRRTVKRFRNARRQPG
jgi:short-subunit dehydrogenase